MLRLTTSLAGLAACALLTCLAPPLARADDAVASESATKVDNPPAAPAEVVENPASKPDPAAQPVFPRVAVPTRIDRVESRGLWRTLPHVVRRECPWKDGEEVTPAQWDLAHERLWLIGIFSRVDAWVELRDGEHVAVFDVEERWTVNLLFRFGVGGGTGWLRLGTYDINSFGQLVELGGLWETFNGQNGGQLWMRIPRSFDQRREIAVVVERLTRPRPGFSTVRAQAQFEYLREIHDRLRWGLRLDAMDDTFVGPLTGTPELPEPSRTLQVGGYLRFGRLRRVRLRDDGWQLEVRPSVATTFFQSAPITPPLPYAAVWSELRAFAMAGERWNLGLRMQAGAQTATQVQQRYYLGGLDMIRGYPDNALRTSAFVMANLELRFIAFDSTWFAALPTVFVDGALTAGETGGMVPAGAIGAGVRLLVPRLVNSGIRLDFAYPLTIGADRAQYFSFGVYQFY